MNYVYILQSISDPDQFYTGLCKDVEARLGDIGDVWTSLTELAAAT